jgi:hypothetical protein
VDRLGAPDGAALARGRGIMRKAATMLVFGLAVAGCWGDELEVTPIYDPGTARIIVKMNRSLEDGETLHVRARRGTIGTGQLDCRALAPTLEPLVDGENGRYFGPTVDQSLLEPFYGPEWASEPTPEMLAALEAGTDSIIDICLMNGGDVVKQIEADLFQAMDNGRAEGLGGKADDPDSGEQAINSPQKYGERCVAELGEIPFFDKRGEWDYTTYNCLDSTPIPMTVTDGAGNVTRPDGTVGKCDKPQYIYSLCEQGPRVASRTNEEGTRWVILCRKSIGGLASDQYNDIAMIGHNPFTGKSCYFQNALYSKRDGGHIPHPADAAKSTNLWSGVHIGTNVGIGCASCHSADAWIHSPWIDGAKDANGREIVPKMGVDEDYPIGANDAPYSIVNLRGNGGVMPKQVVSAEANACLECHRFGDNTWLTSYVDRLDGSDAAFFNITTDAYRTFENLHWMPLDLTGLDASNWHQSRYGQALDFLKSCSTDPSNCQYADIPGAPGGGGGGGALRNPVTLNDTELADQAKALIDQSQCTQCHAITQATLREWDHLSDVSEASCLTAEGGGTPQSRDENESVARDDWKVYGPFDVASGGTLTARITGSGDADLYVKKGSEVTTSSYDCRPYDSDSDEECGAGQFQNTGPAQFWVGIHGYAASSTVALHVEWTAPGGATRPPKEMVACLRIDPANEQSPYSPVKAGIYSAAAHLGWFQDLFKAAYPVDEFGTDRWVIEYGKFKSRVVMPKGNLPRFSQGQFDIVAEWFARGLPQLSRVLPDDGTPTSCTPFISSAVNQHATAMATSGWGAVNRDAGINMFDTSPFPRANSKSYGAGWERIGTLRVLRELDFDTYFWMRSSPDGRFVANGDSSGGLGARMTDLQYGVDIPTDAAYDPGFFPGKDDGWIFQNTPIGTAFCTTALLTSRPSQIDFSEAQCSAVGGIGLYQHLGRGLGGGDHFVINNQFTSDNGGTGPTLQDPSAGFSSSAQMKITPMVFDGAHYVSKPPATVDSPFLGDSVLSPSSKLVVSRLAGPGSRQLGYVMHQITATPSGQSYTVTATEVGRYCTKGAKVSISFDERYMVTHHYVEDGDAADLGLSTSDPQWTAYRTKGAANIVVIDLVTGARTRVTHMQPGQYALFPHFRSDGVIYFVVRDTNTDGEYVVASDAVAQ